MKKWYMSKTVWVNALALVSAVLAQVKGVEVFPVEAQMSVLGLINVGLRFVTKEEVVWK